MPFGGGNQSVPDIFTMCQAMATAGAINATTGGTLSVNSLSLGSYDYAIFTSNQTIAAGWTVANYFTGTADTVSSFICVQGNLTINASQIFTPSVRKLFTAIYVTGNIVVTGAIAMDARGANHAATTAQDIQLMPGIIIPAAGGSGGLGATVAGNGAPGTAGSAGQTGGGGVGGSRSGGLATRNGTAGTSFTGGTASGGINGSAQGSIPVANGGAGGSANAAAAGNQAYGGGAGNPGGAGDTGGGGAIGGAGGNGTGGSLIIYCMGQISGAGTITSAGTAGGSTSGSLAADAGGGASGGGSVQVFAVQNIGPTATALGGAGGVGIFNNILGGNGGNGSARQFIIPPAFIDNNIDNNYRSNPIQMIGY